MDRREFVRTTALVAAGSAIAPALEACKLESRPQLADQSFQQLRDRFFRHQLTHNPVTSTYLGGDGWDSVLLPLNGQLRDFLPGQLQDEMRDYRQFERGHGSIDAALLTPQRRV